MKILIVEDNFETANNYRKYLEKFGHNCDVCASLKEAITLIDKFVYDVLLLDLNLKASYGVDVINYLVNNNIELQTIVISAINEQEKILEVFHNGADDYINKPVNLQILHAKVEAIGRRLNKVVDEFFTLRNLKVNLITKNVYINDEPINLSVKEYEILEVLMKYQGEIVSKEIIANAVYDQYFDPSSTTLRVHIHNLKKKLNKDEEYLVSIQKKGYKLC